MKTPRAVKNHGKTRWLVDLREIGGGRFFIETQNAAKSFQAAKLDEYAKYGQLAFELPHETRQRYLAAENRLVELGATLEQVIAWFEQTHRPAVSKTVPEAVLECLDAKRKAGRKRRTVDQLSYALDSFKKSLLPGVICSEVTTEQVESWLANPKWSARTRKGHLINIRTFFSFARKRSWCPVDPAEHVENILVDEKPPGILTVAQAERLLAATLKRRPDFLPFIVLGLFAGVRSDELKQLIWENVNLKTGYCEITAAIAKGRRRRLIKLHDNVIQWLELGGKLPVIGWQDRWDVVRKAAGFAVAVKRKGKRTQPTNGDPWPKNALRHSFCSYCLPIHGAAQSAEWAGHSEAMLFAHYRELVTKPEAEKFWKLTPKSLKDSPTANRI